MAEQLKKKTGQALIWSFADKGGQQLIQFAFVMVLARLVARQEFGYVGVLTVFIGIANILQDSGFSSAILRRNSVKQEELKAVFLFNISIGFSFYTIMFLAAPLISWYYNQPILTNLSRALFLAFLFNSFATIQNIKLIRAMDFKTNTGITFVAGCVAGLVAVAMAYKGYGAWCLVVQVVLQNLIRSLLLWVFVKWRPTGKASFAFIKETYGYSSRLLFTGIINQICSNIVSIITGKYYSFTQVGLYNQANKLNIIPQSIISDSIKGVAFPLLTKMEDDEERRIKAFRKIIRIVAFVSFPISLILIVMAKPIITIAFSTKWIDAAPILQLLAIGGAVYPLYGLVGTMLQYKGRSGLLLKIESTKNILIILSLIITVRFGVLGMVAGLSVASLVSFVIGFFFLEKTISYKLKDTLLDILPYVAIALVSFAPLYLLEYYIPNIYLLFASQLLVGSTLYLTITKLMGSKVLDDCIAMARGKIQ